MRSKGQSNSYKGETNMHTHDSNGECAAQSIVDGRRDTERRTLLGAAGLALAQDVDAAYGTVHIAAPGKPLNLSAALTGTGGLKS